MKPLRCCQTPTSARFMTDMARRASKQAQAWAEGAALGACPEAPTFRPPILKRSLQRSACVNPRDPVSCLKRPSRVEP